MSQEILTINMQAEVERMKAQIDALNEVRKIFNTQFMSLSERMGELRTLVTGLEKGMKDVHLSAQKAEELVEKVQPENIMREIKKQDAKIDGMRMKLDANETLFTKLTEELREIRKSISLFRGVETLDKMGKDMRADMLTLKKIEDNAKRHADKVETIYLEAQKKFVFEKMNSRIDAFEKLIRNTIRDFDTMRVEMVKLVRKDDLESLKKYVVDKLDRADGVRVYLEEKKEQFELLKLDELSANRKEMSKFIRKLETGLREQGKALDGLIKKSTFLEKTAGEVKSELRGLIETTRREGKESVSELGDEVKKWQKETDVLTKKVEEKLGEQGRAVGSLEKKSNSFEKGADELKELIETARKENRESASELEKEVRRWQKEMDRVVEKVGDVEKSSSTLHSGILKEIRRTERMPAAKRAAVPEAKPKAKKAAAPEPEKRGPAVVETREALEKQKAEMEATLASLDEYRRKGSISEGTYNDLRAANEKKLKKIVERMDAFYK